MHPSVSLGRQQGAFLDPSCICTCPGEQPTASLSPRIKLWAQVLGNLTLERSSGS